MSIESPTLPPTSGPSQKQRATIEIALVLVAFWVPTVALALSDYFAAPHLASTEPAPFTTAYNLAVRLGKILVILFLIWNGGRRFWVFGFRRPTVKEFAIGVGLLALMLVAALGYHWVRDSFQLRQFYTHNPPSSGTVSERMVQMSGSVLYEELFYRSFLLTRLKYLGWHRYSTIFFSAAIFTLPHIYQGVGPLPLVFLHGLFFAWTFLRFKSIWPGLVAHWSYDAILLLSPGLLALVYRSL